MKRCAIQIVLLLILGAIVNVAVAWGLALLVDPFSMPLRSLSVRSGFRIDEDSRFWAASVARRTGAARLNAYTGNQRDGDTNQGEHPDQILPKWWRAGRFRQQPSEQLWSKLVDREVHELEFDEMLHFQSHAEVRGWPLLSMWYEVRHTRNGRPRTVMQALGAIELPLPVWNDPTPFSSAHQPRALPLCPIWPGFAINTMFYAAILWVVLFSPGIIKRTIRRRRGLCPACAYPSGTSEVCTECGAKLPLPLQRERAGVRVQEPLRLTNGTSSTVAANPHPIPLLSKGEGMKRTDP